MAEMAQGLLWTGMAMLGLGCLATCLVAVVRSLWARRYAPAPVAVRASLQRVHRRSS
ncbi:MAG: hypothetical protein HY332_01220 [Chloroflexi bacterium]|nr:hypothetical protein [Chloroflexota bacterium]